MSQCEGAEDWLYLCTGMPKLDLSAVCTDIPSFSPPCTHTHVHTHAHTRAHAHTQTHTHTHAHTCTHTLTHTYTRTHTRTHARTHTHTHSHTCTHTQYTAVSLALCHCAACDPNLLSPAPLLLQLRGHARDPAAADSKAWPPPLPCPPPATATRPCPRSCCCRP